MSLMMTREEWSAWMLVQWSSSRSAMSPVPEATSRIVMAGGGGSWVADVVVGDGVEMEEEEREEREEVEAGTPGLSERTK